jgi:23S rRNA (cytidine1920-2'-O)/16S rRNA (cytidine1409-2'-O)-methyltransferase
MNMRLDVFLAKNGLAESREKAKHLIKGGKVLVNGNAVTKTSKEIKDGDDVKVAGSFGYVSRGGYKLEEAAKKFGLDFDGKIVADVGCSKGGFTDFALKHGAEKVYSIDTGDELHDSLKDDSRVVCMPGTDAKTVKILPDQIDICLIDVTFCPLEDMLVAVKDWLHSDSEIVGLIKPAFEIGEWHDKINPEEVMSLVGTVVERIERDYKVKGLVESGLEGKTAGQKEFFVLLKPL